MTLEFVDVSWRLLRRGVMIGLPVTLLIDSDDDNDVSLRRRRGGGVGTQRLVIRDASGDNDALFELSDAVPDVFDVDSLLKKFVNLGSGGVLSQRCKLAVLSQPGRSLMAEVLAFRL